MRAFLKLLFVGALFGFASTLSAQAAVSDCNPNDRNCLCREVNFQNTPASQVWQFWRENCLPVTTASNDRDYSTPEKEPEKCSYDWKHKKKWKKHGHYEGKKHKKYGKKYGSHGKKYGKHSGKGKKYGKHDRRDKKYGKHGGKGKKYGKHDRRDKKYGKQGGKGQKYGKQSRKGKKSDGCGCGGGNSNNPT